MKKLLIILAAVFLVPNFNASALDSLIPEEVIYGLTLSYGIFNLNELAEIEQGFKQEFGELDKLYYYEKIELAKDCLKKATTNYPSISLGTVADEYLIKYSIYAIILAPNQPEAAEAYYNLGSALFSDEVTESAIYFYEKAAELNPDHAEAYWGLGFMYYSLVNLKNRKDKLDEAKAALIRAKTLLREQDRLGMLKELEEMEIELFQLSEEN